jgi:hypothetical protein
MGCEGAYESVCDIIKTADCQVFHGMESEGVVNAIPKFKLPCNILTWHGTIWFHWPALGWGLLLFLHWIKGSNASARRKS